MYNGGIAGDGEDATTGCIVRVDEEMVMKLSPEELRCVLSEEIEAVNHGSVKSIDLLVREALTK